MKKNIFAVCDLEADYARNFAEYLTRKNNLPFEIHAFTNTAALEAFAEDHAIELLLISSKAMTPRLKELNITKTVVLSDESHPKELPELTCVYKYQSSAQVLKEAMAAYSEVSVQPQIVPVLKKNTSIYGIYSPAGGCGKTSLALALAMELSRQRRVLFLSLEGCSGLSGLQQCTHTLSDLLYYARQKDSRLIHRMSAIIQAFEGVDFIPPVTISEDIHQAAWADLSFLIREILTHSAYEALVIDVGLDFAAPVPLLEECDQVLMPLRSDGIGHSKISQFEQLLEQLEAETVLKKLKQIRTPVLRQYLPVEEYLKGLAWTSYGALARQILADGP